MHNLKKLLLIFLVTLVTLPVLAQQISNELQIAPSNDTLSTHLMYKAVRVTNSNLTQSTTINSLEIQSPLIDNNLIQYCEPNYKNCDYFSQTSRENKTPACVVGMQLPPSKSCNIWFTANAIGKISTPQDLAITVTTNIAKSTQTFKVNYEQNLYVGGRFNHWPSVTSGVIKWDGHNWSSLAGLDMGQYDDSVMSLAISDNYLYAGGNFRGYVARYDLDTTTPSWQIIPGLYDAAQTLQDFKHQLYAGGEFSGAYRLNKNDQWERIGTFEKGVNQYRVMNNTLFAAGQFTNKVIKLNDDKTSWSQVGTGLTSTNNMILVGMDNTLYTGGYYNAYKLYKCSLDGTPQWIGLDADPLYETIVLTAAALDHQIYIGTMNGLFVLNNEKFTPLLPPTVAYARINSLLTVGNTLLVGSNIDDAPGSLNWLAKYDNHKWTRIAPQEWDAVRPVINAMLIVPTWSIHN